MMAYSEVICKDGARICLIRELQFLPPIDPGNFSTAPLQTCSTDFSSHRWAPELNGSYFSPSFMSAEARANDISAEAGEKL